LRRLSDELDVLLGLLKELGVMGLARPADHGISLEGILDPSLDVFVQRGQRLGEVNSVYVLPVEAPLDDVGSVHCGREQAGLDRPAAAVDHLMLEGEG